MNGERKFQMTYNALGQFFMVVYCADGSICEYGPFASGEEAAQCQYEIENPSFDDIDFV